MASKTTTNVDPPAAQASSANRRLNIWYINHYAERPPESRSGRPGFLAQELASLGHEVLVIAASEHHLRVRPLPPEELGTPVPWENAHFLFLPARSYEENGSRRFRNMRDFAQAIGGLEGDVRAGRLAKPDVIIASSAHLFVYRPAHAVARSLGARIVLEVRDIWPLSLVEIAGVHRWHPIVKLMEWLERRAYRSADAVVSLLPNALEHMQPRGLDPGRFHWIPNGVRVSDWEGEVDPLPESHQHAFDACEEQGKLAVVYTGAHGPPNALDQLLGLAEVRGTAESDRPYQILLIGDGVSKPALVARGASTGADFLTFLPPITKAQARAAIARADVCFIGWQDRPIYRYGVSANKLFEYMVAAKPVLHALAGCDDPVQASGGGIRVHPDRPAELDEALRRFAAMEPTERARMGERGREYVLAEHDWRVLGARYAALCESLVGTDC